MSDEKKSLINIELIPKELITNIFGPASKSIGEGLGGIANYVMGPLRRLNITSEKSFQDFVDKINTNTDEIPPENRDISKLGLALKTMEDARYQLENEEMREYFANLLAGLVDNRKNSQSSPRFSMILSELTTKEARLLSEFYNLKGIPTESLRVQKSNGDGVDLIENLLLIDENNYVDENLAIKTLQSYGLIDIAPSVLLKDEKKFALYDIFENSKQFSDTKDQLIKDFQNHPYFIGIDFDIINSRGSITITDLGDIFCSMIFPEKE